MEEYTKAPVRGTELKASAFMEMDPPENKARIAENKDKPKSLRCDSGSRAFGTVGQRTKEKDADAALVCAWAGTCWVRACGRISKFDMVRSPRGITT